MILKAGVLIVSFTIDGMHPHDTCELLDKENIAVRGGFHCAKPLFSKLGLDGSIRASFYIYNTAKEVDHLTEALLKAGREIKEEVNRVNPIDLNEIASVNLTEEQEIYKDNVIDHYKHPRNKREMADFTVAQRGVNPLCGDAIVMYIKTKENMIIDVSFTGDGCAISQASASLLTEKTKGKTVKEAAEFNSTDMFSLLGIPINHTRTKCALLSLKTLHQYLLENDTHE